MAKGTLHLNVEFSAVADEEGKFARLAKLLGLADADHARGKCEHLWVACTRRGEAELPQWLVEQILGDQGPEALVEAELASWSAGRGDSKTRRLRIGGAASSDMPASPPARLVTYAIEAVGASVVKVGRTSDITRRIAALQTGHHTQLVLFGIVDGDREESLHANLDALGKRVRGEWFQFDAETIELLAGHGITRSA